MLKGLIFDIKRYAIHDGPGIRTTVFLKGCPLSCRWCDNPESQDFLREFIFWPERCLHCDACINVCKKKAIIKSENNKRVDETKCDFCESCVRECYSEALQIVGREISIEELLDEIRKDSDFYVESGGGGTFSGGEPFSQSDFLCEMLAACKRRGIHTAIETCGFVSWDILEKTTPNVDLFLYDIKSMDEKRHKEFTGVSNRLILENLEKLARNSQVIVRVPLIPQINDDEDNISRLGKFLSRLERIEEVDLLPYHRLGISKYERLNKTYALKKITPPVQDRVDDIRKALEKFGFRINVGG